MNELRSKAEFFQQYIMDRFKKLHEQRSVGTNTDASAEALPRSESIEHMVQDCDDIAAKVILNGQYYICPALSFIVKEIRL